MRLCMYACVSVPVGVYMCFEGPASTCVCSLSLMEAAGGGGRGQGWELQGC